MTGFEPTIYEPPEGKEGPGALIQIEQQRAIQEVQAAVIVAKRFPRNEEQSLQNILKACRRRTLAEKAKYTYPRGGTVVEGPSIRLAEVLAQNWQNIQYGIRELAQRDGVSDVEAYAWDLETNVRASRHFQVRHIRYSKKQGFTDLEDPRDIYEMVANQGSRRVRACILQIIPGDIVEEAEIECEKTLKQGSSEPIEARVRKMAGAFSDQGVNVAMIEKRLGHKLGITTETELIQLRKIYQSLKDGMAKREDFFEFIAPSGDETGEDKPKERRTRSDKGQPRISKPSETGESDTQPPLVPGTIEKPMFTDEELAAEARKEAKEYMAKVRPDLRNRIEEIFPENDAVQNMNILVTGYGIKFPDKMTDNQVKEIWDKLDERGRE